MLLKFLLTLSNTQLLISDLVAVSTAALLASESLFDTKSGGARFYWAHGGFEKMSDTEKRKEGGGKDREQY